jgi:hypothetical protein
MLRRRTSIYGSQGCCMGAVQVRRAAVDGEHACCRRDD